MRLVDLEFACCAKKDNAVSFILRKQNLTEYRVNLSVLAKLQALSNETRFEIIKMARAREMSAGAIAKRFKMTRPAVSQHLGMLRAAGLLDERRVGSKRLYIVRADGFDELAEFVETFWQVRLKKLKLAAEAVERSKEKK